MTAARTKTLTLILAVGVLVVGGWAMFRPPRLPPVEPRQPRPDAENVIPATRVDRPPVPSQGYVGSAICRDCHGEICDSYETHSMAHATARVDEVERIEDFTLNTWFDAPPSSLRPFDVRYYVSEEAGVVYHHERATAFDGTELYDQAVPIHYEVGSGVRGRSYITNRDGVLLMSPITWYSGAKKWDFSPGYRINNFHFERRIIDQCIHCHVGRLEPAEGLHDQFDPARPVIEGAISCERCHGPGQHHVAFRRDELPPEESDRIVNPSGLEPHLRDSVCYQCHFHGVERITRYGRSEFDFRPGDDICDIWTVFIHGTGIDEDATTEAVTQTEQMLSSVCYEGSAGRLGCVSCHDPHSLPAESERSDYYRARCLDCHAAGDPPCSEPLEQRLSVSADDSCIDCHMPSIAANDVPHTSQTDHRVPRSLTDRTIQRENNVLTIFREETGHIPEVELRRARAIFLVMHAERSNNAAMAFEAVAILKEWLEAAPDDLKAIEALGIALRLGEETNAAVEVWERGLALDPNHEDLLRRLTIACQEHEQTDLGATYARRLVEVNPWAHENWGRFAHLLGQQGEFEEGIEAAERALEIRPSNALIHGWLVEAYEQVGNHEEAAEHQRMFDYLTAGE